MNLAIPGAVRHLYHLQMDLTAARHASRASAYLSNYFHRDMQLCQSLCVDMGYQPNIFTENFQRVATDVGYDDASGLGCGGVCIDPNEDGVHYVWSLPWTEDIMADLVITDNPRGCITNYDLELAALVLQEATLPFVSTNLAWQVPFSGSDNTLTVAWTFQKYSTVNLLVDLLRLWSLANPHFKITPSLF